MYFTPSMQISSEPKVFAQDRERLPQPRVRRDRRRNHLLMKLRFFISVLFPILFFSQCLLFTQTRKVESKPSPILDAGNQPIRVYWVGHATTLVRIYDKWILTDPIWNDNLLYFFGRHVEPGIDLQNLPKPDAVLISHAHFDHMDNYTLKRLPKDLALFLPKGSPNYKSYGFREIRDVSPLDEWEKNGLKVTAVPARHFGGRWLIDNLWDGEPYTGYLIEYKGKSIYFAGDTGYDQSIFQSVGKKANLDIAILPMGPYRGIGGELGNPVHVNPNGAVKAFEDTGAKFMVPMHFGTFYTAPETEFPYVLEAIQKSPLKDRIRLLKQGEYSDFP